MIHWERSGSILLCNPKYTNQQQKQFESILKATEGWPEHIWFATSGSISPKWVGLSQSALRTSAEAVNAHLSSDASDRWSLALPSFHVGGWGIRVRSALTGAKVDDFYAKQNGKWDPRVFLQHLTEEKITLTSLVPTQLLDLIQLQASAPPHLRAVIIGGGYLSEKAYLEARHLNWPILPSYGMTECASQIATAPLSSLTQHCYPALELLPCWNAREIDDRLAFYGPAIFSLYAYEKSAEIILDDPKVDGWLISQDIGAIEGRKITCQGRSDKMIKIGGESVDLNHLEEVLNNISREIQTDAVLVPMSDQRLGTVLHLAVTPCSDESLKSLLAAYHSATLPFEQIRRVHHLPYIPRSPLGKVQLKQLNELISYALS